MVLEAAEQLTSVTSYGTVLPGFDDVFEQFESPLRQIQVAQQVEAGPGSSTKSWNLHVRKEWTVDLRAARIFLSEHLAPVREGHFRFLELPPEIRTAIYEHVLQSPPVTLRTAWSGVMTVPEVDRLAERSLGDDWPPGRVPRSPNEALAVIFVNKQVYREALPVFHSILQLSCEDMGRLEGFVRSLQGSNPEQVPTRPPLCTVEPIRFHCLKTLHVDYRDSFPRHSDSDPSADFLGAKGLRHLTITVHKKYWNDTWFSDTTVEEPNGLPFMASLVRLLSRVASYELLGEGGKIRTYIEAELEKVEELVNDKE